jgi:hypothetical protein
MPEIVEAADRFKKALLNENNAALRQMVHTYSATWKNLQTRLKAVTDKIALALESGEEIKPSWLFQQERFRELMWQAEQEILVYSRYAAAMVGRQQQRGLTLGEEHSKQLMIHSLGPMPEELYKAGYRVTWNRVPREAVKNIVGFLADGSPLDYKFAGLAQETAQGIKDAIAIGLGTGQNPRTIARTIKRAYNGALANTLNTCRTEVMRAYREASHQNYVANSDIVRGWIRSCAHSARTCIACWAQDGTFHKLSERLTDHTCGRCVAIPATRPWSELVPGTKVKETGVQTWDSEEAFKKLSSKDQIRVMGPARYRLWKEGKVKFKGLATLKKSKVWGNHYEPTPLKQLVKEGKITKKELSWAQRRPRPVKEGHAKLLTTQEREAIKKYTGSSYREINQKLRDGKALSETQKKVIKHMDSALEKLPPYGKTTYRRVSFYKESELTEFLEKHNVGDIVTYGQYLSTDKRGLFHASGEFKVRMLVNGKRGSDISHLSLYPAEEEVLFSRTSSFIVKEMRKDEDGWKAIIVIEEI